MKKNTVNSWNPKTWVRHIRNPQSAIDETKRAFMPVPKMPGETEAQARLRIRQAEDSAKLDSEENRRLKQLFSASRGTRAYRGGPLSRAAPGNTRGATPRSAAGAGAAGAGAVNLRAGGMRGGLIRGGLSLVS